MQKPTEAAPQSPEAKAALSAQTTETPPAPPIDFQPIAPASTATPEQTPLAIGPPAATFASNTLPKIPKTLPQTSPQSAEPTPAPSTPGAPTLMKYVEPAYPREAHLRSMEGWVLARLQVNPAGDVVNARIEDGERRQLFARAALAAVRQWKYEPRPQAAGEASVVVRLEFKLDR
jgi:periplasmic protein TonB